MSSAILFQQLIELIKDEEFVYIQTHNFPDNDAVATAFALQYLLKQYNLESRIVYEGEIYSEGLLRMIKELHIDIKDNTEYPIKESDKIIIVDGCKGNNNVIDLIGDEVAVIDHHEVSRPDDVPFSDIRSDFGSCAAVIFSYFKDLDIEIPKEVATALLIGINTDTSLLTRGVDVKDVEAYYFLFPIADTYLVNSILRNHFNMRDLESFKHILENLQITGELAFCYFPDGCPQNLLGIIGDFILSLVEIDFVILCAKNEGKVSFSLRNERAEWNAARIIRDVLDGIGFGGGHADMAGGMIPDVSNFNEKDIRSRFIHELGLKQ